MTLIRHPPSAGATFPPGEGKHEEMGAFPHQQNYVFLLASTKRTVSAYPCLPLGEGADQLCGGRRDELRASSGSHSPFPLGSVSPINPNLINTCFCTSPQRAAKEMGEGQPQPTATPSHPRGGGKKLRRLRWFFPPPQAHLRSSPASATFKTSPQNLRILTKNSYNFPRNVL